MNFEEIKQIEDEFQLATYKKMDVAVERAAGSWVWVAGRDEPFLDLYGGHAVCATGHSHPHVVAAIKDQLDKISFYSNLVYSDIRGKAAKKLVSVAPDALTKAFFCNSGTEANENAMRIARMSTGRDKIISFDGSFHGRTSDAISATFLGKYRDIGKPNVPGHIAAEFGNIESVRSVADRETAAIILEPIQSMAGVREARPTFFTDLRSLCDELGIVLIFDEVQTGMGRTGSWFFAGSENAGGAVPDIVTLAKSLGSGVPVGACLVSESVSAHIKTNDLGTTFGGGMIAMAAVLATIEAIENDAMVKNASDIFQYLRDSIGASQTNVVAIHGKGCLIGLEFEDNAAAVHERLLEQSIITGTSSKPKVLRLLPSLNVTTDELDIFIGALQG